MRFLVVGTDYPPLRGGISTYTVQLARALAENHEVALLAPGAVGAVEFDRTQEYRVVRTSALPGLRILLLLLYLPWMLVRYRPEAVLHTVWPTALLSHLWKILAPVPYFVSVHASEILDDRRTWRRRAKGWLGPWRRAALKQACALFPVSSYTARRLIEMGFPESSIRVITNGVDPERFRPGKGRSGKAGSKRLLTVARLDLHKGHDRVIEALALLKKEGIRPCYRIVGEGDEEGRLRKMTSELGLSEQVEFSGFIPDEQLPAIYAAADIFIMASREMPGRVDLIEGFGISFLEAGACGLPCVAGRSGGVADAVIDGETGILVEPEDPRAIARAIETLLSDEKLARRMGRAGRKRAETEMSWESVAGRLWHEMRTALDAEETP